MNYHLVVLEVECRGVYGSSSPNLLLCVGLHFYSILGLGFGFLRLVGLLAKRKVRVSLRGGGDDRLVRVLLTILSTRANFRWDAVNFCYYRALIPRSRFGAYASLRRFFGFR